MNFIPTKKCKNNSGRAWYFHTLFIKYTERLQNEGAIQVEASGRRFLLDKDGFIARTVIFLSILAISINNKFLDDRSKIIPNAFFIDTNAVM